MRNLILLFTLASFQVFSQSTFYVKDSYTEESIPFVKIIPDQASPFLADLDGAFTLASGIQSFKLSYRGYQDTTYQVASLTDSIVYLSPNVQMVNEVTVVPGVNPAHRIMRNAIKNRKANHPLKNDAFRYKSYSKFIFDINPDALAAISDTTTDSLLIGTKMFFEQQHLFMMESASKRTFVPPYRDKEEITAYKVSGFSDPRFSTFANSMQSFSFYDNQFNLLGSDYINPLAFGGINRYLFVLEDSTFHDSDTTYTIYYRPRKGKGFNGIEGHLYINTNGFAVEKVIASPYRDTTGLQVKIVQQYEFIEGKKWFPTKLSTEVNFGDQAKIANIKDGNVQGTGYTYMEDIEIRPDDLPKRFNDNISLYTAEDANELNEGEWDSLRRYQITDKERTTYHTIDSLSKVMKFDSKLKVLNSLLEGKIPLGNYQIPIDRIFNFNIYEGYRFGVGLENSKKMMKNVVIGGYAGWATRDKEWKYGGYSTIFFSRQKRMKIDLKYQQDLMERGGTSFAKSGFSLNDTEMYRHFYITNMERQRIGEVAFSSDIKANMNLRVFGNYQRVWFIDSYTYSPADTNIYTNDDHVNLAETGIEFKWNILEKYVLLGDMKMSQGKKYPSIKLKAVHGWKGWIESNYDYWRLSAEISQDFNFLGIGKLTLTARAQKTIGDVPLFLSNEGNGTGKNWMLSVPNTFETMAPSSFYSTEQAAIYARFGFRAFKTKAAWNEPKFSLHHAWGIGNFYDRSAHSVDFQTYEKGYGEVGIILDGLFTSSTSGIGIGAFYNYSSYGDSEDWVKNIVPKLSVSFSLE